MRKTLSFLLAVVMTLAMMSGLVLFEASAANEVHVSMPGFNQYTPEQMQKMAINHGRNYVFEKDDAGHTVITGTPTVDDYDTNLLHFATADKFDQWNKNGLIDGLSPFGDVDVSNKLGFRFKIVVLEGKQPDYVGFCFGSSKKRIAIDFRRADYDPVTGYYEVRWSKTGWYGVQIQGDDWYKDCASIADTYYANIDQFQFKMEMPTTKPVKFYMDDMYTYANVATDDLHKAIVRAEGIAGISQADIDAAVDLYKNSAIKDQATIDAMTNKLNGMADEIEKVLADAKDELNSLLDEADMLGYFDPESEHYYLACDADMVISNPDSSLEEILLYIKQMRDVVYTEYMEEDLAEVLVKLDNLWKYNYTEESYNNAVAVAEEVWKDYEAEDALQKAQAAYNSLVKISTSSASENLFTGWASTDVNDVVEANSEKLCDSIGDGLNKKDIWNAGDFTNNTIFEADDGEFSMTAEVDLGDGAIGWKNMDRSGILAGRANEGYPVLTTAGLSKADGIRFKLNVEGGSFRRLLIGFSNCADLSHEMYAKNIPALAGDDEGYVNIPFTAFESAWWSTKFAPDEYEKMIVFIIEAYGVTEGTCITISDMHGYVELIPASQEDIARLNTAVTNLKNFDIENRYADLAKEGEDLVQNGGFVFEVTDVLKRISTLLGSFGDPEGSIVDVPGYSIYTQDEISQFVGRGCEYKSEKTANGVKFIRKAGTTAVIANGTYGGSGDGYEDGDTTYGPITAINGKTFIDMLGGFNLTDIYAFRFKIEGAFGQVDIIYKDGVGLWGGLATDRHKVSLGADGYYTFYMDQISTAGLDGWYAKDFTIQQIREMTKFIVLNLQNNLNKNVYGWQVIMSAPIDRTGLKKVIDNVEAVREDAINLYYNDKATQEQIDEFIAPYLKLINKPEPPMVQVTNLGITSATITPLKGVEYKLGESGTWTTDNVFSSLKADTAYEVYARYAETDTAAASDETVVKFTTLPYTFGDATIEIQGEAVYAETLTALTNAIPAELDGHTTITWNVDGEKVSEGAEFVIDDKAYIGKAIVAVLVSDLFDGKVESDPTALVSKAQPEIITMPEATPVVMGAALSTSQLLGGETDVPGTWKFVNPSLVLTLQQSGSKVDIYFIPDDADAYETLTASVVVNILAATDSKVLTNEALGITVSGEFFNQTVTGDTVEFNAIQAGTAAYLDLLRAAKYSESDNNMIFLYTADFGGEPAYLGTLEFTTKISSRYAGEEYTFWFFADGQVTSYTTVVGTDGTVTISDVIL